MPYRKYAMEVESCFEYSKKGDIQSNFFFIVSASHQEQIFTKKQGEYSSRGPEL